MGHVLLYTVMGALALFVLALAFVIDTGGGFTKAATEVLLDELLVAPQAHVGERVSTEGVLDFEEPEGHFAVTAGGSAVVVRGYSAEKLRRLVGRSVTVTGLFGFDDVTGAYIEVEAVTPHSRRGRAGTEEALR